MSPRITVQPTRNLSIVLGETFRIQCKAAGWPHPYINWRLNWGHVCEEPRCFSTSSNGCGILTVTDARLSDAGAYSCEAINSQGRVFAVPDSIVTVFKKSKCKSWLDDKNLDNFLCQHFKAVGQGKSLNHSRHANQLPSPPGRPPHKPRPCQ